MKLFNYKVLTRFFIIFLVLISFMFVCGNFFNLGFFSKKINLGLDLKGGSHILLSVDFDYYLKDELNNNKDLIKSEFFEKKIRALPKVLENEIKIEFRRDSEIKEIKKIVKKINEAFIFNLLEKEKIITLRFSEKEIKRLKHKLTIDTAEIIRKRIDGTGTKDPLIQIDENNNILIQVAGIKNSTELKQILGKTAKLTFHFLEEDEKSINAMKVLEPRGNYEISVKKDYVLSGEYLKEASVQQNNGKSVIFFKFNTIGAKKFEKITRENVGKILVIVLDNEVIMTPKINGEIAGGSGIISGDFTVEEASKMALLLRSGSFSAPVKIIEERSVGATLGEKSIQEGMLACSIGLILIVLFLLIFYKKYGIYSIAVLFINISVLISFLSLTGVVLTMTGIAGFILTMGVGIDSSILIFERIKEEKRKEKNMVIVIDKSFENSFRAILDSNLTTVMVGICLYIFGTGSVKSFAIVLILGIISSLFANIYCLRSILDITYRNNRYEK